MVLSGPFSDDGVTNSRLHSFTEGNRTWGLFGFLETDASPGAVICDILSSRLAALSDCLKELALCSIII
jgi:hypothetical protein